ncbi:hypothetical protein STEG23_008117 [Scotinomys teguina]
MLCSILACEEPWKRASVLQKSQESFECGCPPQAQMTEHRSPADGAAWTYALSFRSRCDMHTYPSGITSPNSPNKPFLP